MTVALRQSTRFDASSPVTRYWLANCVGFSLAGGGHGTVERILADVDPNDTHKWVAVSGHAQLTEEGADAQIDKLAKKYLGKDEYPWRNPGETRVSVKITPEKVDSTGFDES